MLNLSSVIAVIEALIAASHLELLLAGKTSLNESQVDMLTLAFFNCILSVHWPMCPALPENTF